jgi:hypothetical protein
LYAIGLRPQTPSHDGVAAPSAPLGRATLPAQQWTCGPHDDSSPCSELRCRWPAAPVARRRLRARWSLTLRLEHPSQYRHQRLRRRAAFEGEILKNNVPAAGYLFEVPGGRRRERRGQGRPGVPPPVPAEGREPGDEVVQRLPQDTGHRVVERRVGARAGTAVSRCFVRSATRAAASWTSAAETMLRGASGAGRSRPSRVASQPRPKGGCLVMRAMPPSARGPVNAPNRFRARRLRSATPRSGHADLRRADAEVAPEPAGDEDAVLGEDQLQGDAERKIEDQVAHARSSTRAPVQLRCALRNRSGSRPGSSPPASRHLSVASYCAFASHPRLERRGRRFPPRRW